jgi:hypothetical protein
MYLPGACVPRTCAAFGDELRLLSAALRFSDVSASTFCVMCDGVSRLAGTPAGYEPVGQPLIFPGDEERGLTTGGHEDRYHPLDTSAGKLGAVGH